MKAAQNLSAGSVHGSDGIPNEFWTLFASKSHKIENDEGNIIDIDNPLACLLSMAYSKMAETETLLPTMRESVVSLLHKKI